MTLKATLVSTCLVLAKVTYAQEITVDNPQDVQEIPNWTPILLFLIISSAIALVIGLVLMIKKAKLPPLPELEEPNFKYNQQQSVYSIGNDLHNTTYTHFPMEYGLDNLSSGGSSPAKRTGSKVGGKGKSVNVQTQRM